MPIFKVGDRVKVLDKPGWPDGYKLAKWEGTIVKIAENPAGYVMMKADKTGYDMMFQENELELVQPSTNADQSSDHDGTLGLIDALQKKTKGNSSADVRLDL